MFLISSETAQRGITGTGLGWYRTDSSWRSENFKNWFVWKKLNPAGIRRLPSHPALEYRGHRNSVRSRRRAEYHYVRSPTTPLICAPQSLPPPPQPLPPPPFFVLFLFFKRERGDPVKSRFSPKWVSVPVYFHAQGNMSLRYPWRRHTELTSTGILCSNYAQVIPFTWNVVVRSGVSRTQKSSLSVCAENPELSKVLFSSL